VRFPSYINFNVAARDSSRSGVWGTHPVDCVGHRRQVHIDHLLLEPTTDKLHKNKLTGQDDSQIAESSTGDSFSDSSLLENSLVESPNTYEMVNPLFLLPNAIPVPAVHKSLRATKKPQRLIEEMT